MSRFLEVGCSSLAWAAIALVPACSLPRSVTALADVGTSQADAFAGGIDVGPGHDGGHADDAFTPVDDAWLAGNDAYVAPIDAYVAPVDASVARDTAMPPPCYDTFHTGLTSYTDCSTDGVSCTFYLQLGSGTSCDDICGMTGHTCTAAIDNNPANHCSSQGGAQACSHDMSDAICSCSWP